MSFIQFESAREKDKIRKELREARQQLLEKAKGAAEQRAQREAQKELRGETNWMLPSVSEKLEKMSKKSKPFKKSKKKLKEKKSKKSKKASKKRGHCTSSDEDDSSDEEGSESGKKRKSRKSSKKKRSHKYNDSTSDSEVSSSDSSAGHRIKRGRKKKKSKSSSSSAAESDTDGWTERIIKSDKYEAPMTTTTTVQRDSWMTDALMLKTYSRERVEKQPNERQQQIEAYDPAKSSRELNTYWKSTGSGLPAFQKPADDDDINGSSSQARRALSSKPATAINSTATRGWKKPQNEGELGIGSQKRTESKRSPSPASETSGSSSDNEGKPAKQTETSQFLTDQQMNELGAKILKAEIMGNAELAEDLKKRLESAREQRAAFKERKQQEVSKRGSDQGGKEKRSKHKGEQDEEHVLLTRSDERGNCRPLAQTRTTQPLDPRDLYGGRSGRKKQKHQRVETHVSGERVRYFPDDDKYDIKQMFEREKYTNAADSNLQFADIASKHKNPNDDLDDIFADQVRKQVSQEDTDQRERQRAMYEHQKLTAQLDNCTKCFDSDKMDKNLLVAMGEKVYLALPWHVGLQTGHCIIVPTQHVSCSTQLDEDTWEEIGNFRKALVRLFAGQRKDVIFFEIANKLQRRPHLSIHCIPIPDAQAEMAPFYFKKAIEESEHEWSVNKQLVSLRDKGLRRAIPKGLPYFWVNFGMDTGFAHVIEDQDRFPANYAQEIIGGMLNLDPNRWRKPQKEQNIIAKVKMFADWWKKYDCTN